MLKEKRKEIHQFTILYFFGIIMMASLHCKDGGISLFYDWFDPAGFVLTLFSFSSGYFFTKNIDRKPLTIIWKKILKFIIPLYGWNFFYGILVAILKNIGFIKFGGALNFYNCFLGPICSTLNFRFNKATWFIVPLFLVQIFSILILPILKKRKCKYNILIFIIYVIGGMLGIKISMMGTDIVILKILAKFLCVCPFFALGILYKENLEKYDKLSNSVYFLIIFVLQYLFIYINNGMPDYEPLYGSGYENIFSPIICGILGIAFWYRISKILVPILKNSKIVNLIGKNTFSIMVHHYFGFFVLNLILIFFNTYFDMFSGFRFKIFQSKLLYIYLPKDLPQFRTFYIVFGIGVSLIIAYIENKVKYLFIKFFEKYKINNNLKKNKKLLLCDGKKIKS